MTIRTMRIPRNPRFGAGLSPGSACYIQQIGHETTRHQQPGENRAIA